MNFGTSVLRTQYNPYLANIQAQILVANQNYVVFLKLRQALKLSLQRFTIDEMQKPSKMIQKVKIPQKSEQKKSVVIELLSSDEEKNDQFSKIENDSNRKVNKNQSKSQQIEDKTDHSKDHGEFLKEQDINDQQPTLNSIRKTTLIRKQKSSKVINKLKKFKYETIEKKLDLTDFVIIKNTPFSVQELNRRRQALLLRNVRNWDQTANGRKQRREIRMLKN